jgi:proteasome lid subunit RPN8/RPN11
MFEAIAPITIPADLLRQCFAHGQETYPEEACGYLSGPEAQAGVLTAAHPIPNIQNRMHAEDPETYPRTAREAYFLDPKVRLPLERRLRAEGRALRVIYHTHPDVGAYFSAEDKRKAVLPNGDPLMPGVIYLVCGITRREPDGAILAWWDEAERAWKEAQVEPPRHIAPRH